MSDIAQAWDIKKIIKKVPRFLAIVVICITTLSTYTAHKAERLTRPGTSREPEVSALTKELAQLPERLTQSPLATGDIKVKAGEWLKVEVGEKIGISTPYGISCTYKVNEDPKEYKSGPNGEKIDLFGLNPGIRINVIWIRPERDATITVTR